MKAIRFPVLGSTKTTIVLLFMYAIILAGATFLEKYHGTVAAKAMIYYSPVFILLQLFMVLNFIVILWQRNYLKSRKWGLLVSHISFIVILFGALVSHLFSEEGMIHIREGESSDQLIIQTQRGTTYKTLPFRLELIKFNLEYYPGSTSPSAYESELKVHVDGRTFETKVFMNNVLDLKGYRFFQASFDQDEKGTILSVNRDVWGRNITYTGYAFLLIGLILCLTGKNSRFRILNHQLKEIKNTTAKLTVCIILLLSPSFNLNAKNTSKENDKQIVDVLQTYIIAPEHAAKFGSLPMQSFRGRMIPVNTFSSEIVRKLHKKEKVGKLNSDQFLLSVLSLPEMWMRVPFIAVSNKELINYFDLTGKESSYADMFDTNGQYKLEEMVRKAYNKMPSQRTGFDKDLLKLDEQINIFHQILNKQLINLFPLESDPNNKWYAPGEDLSDFSGQDSMFVSRIMDWYLSEVQTGMKSGNWQKADEVLNMVVTYQQAKNKTLDIHPEKIQREIQYNKLGIFQKCKLGYLILGGLLLIISFCTLFKKSKFLTIIYGILALSVIGISFFQMFGMGLRWYIGGYAPWSNSYETMVYVAWATVFAGLLFIRRSSLTFALATLFGGVILFVSGLNLMDPQIGTLVPVLKSPWLMFHVAVIVAAYGFFGISFLIGITNLVMMCFSSPRTKPILVNRIKELSIINEMSLIIGLILMTTGTFLGAVWANESWGRYWGWDPKETWALITMVVYAVVTHLRLVPKFNNGWLFNFSSVLAFASVLMTFFGVNYFLNGMHSYGENSNIHGIFIYLYIIAGAISILSIFSYRGYNKQK
nr:cytochrome c biogenesis protein CcsA [Parabacteroides pacaensis]